MFTQSERDEIDALIGIPFETFKEEIVVYQTPTVTYISSSPEFNFAFEENQPAAETAFVPKSGTFMATVQYLVDLKENENFFPTNDAQVKRV